VREGVEEKKKREGRGKKEREWVVPQREERKRKGEKERKERGKEIRTHVWWRIKGKG
jgi:hypothetical protein